jgi:hypothetical protein
MNDQRFPKGWDQQRVQELLTQLDSRTDEEWVVVDEAAAAESAEQSVVTVPTSLLPEIRRLLAMHNRILREPAGNAIDASGRFGDVD